MTIYMGKNIILLMKKISITIDDDLLEKIEKTMKIYGKTNKSEYINALIRRGFV